MSEPEPGLPPDTSELQTRALGVAALACIGVMLLAAALGRLVTAEVDLEWYRALVRPGLEPPQALVVAVSVLYYPLFFVLIYRILARVGERRPQRTAVALVLLAMLLNTLWNPVLIGTRSLVAGVAGNALLVLTVASLTLFLRKRERTSALILLPYLAWVTFELAWSVGLLALNR